MSSLDDRILNIRIRLPIFMARRPPLPPDERLSLLATVKAKRNVSFIPSSILHKAKKVFFSLRCGTGEVFHRSIVSLPDCPNAFTSIVQLVVLRPLGNERSDSTVVVLRHGWKEMVFKLILHSTPEPFHEEVITASVARGEKLCFHEGAIGVEEHLFALMGGGDDAGDQKTAEKNRAERYGPTESEQPQIVQRDEHPFSILRGAPGMLQRLPTPAEIQQRVHRDEVEVLIGAKPDVVFSGGEKEMKDGIIGNVGINADVIRVHVVSVVLVRPPTATEPIDRTRHHATHPFHPRASAMSIVMSDPTGLLHSQANGHDRQEIRPEIEMTDHSQCTQRVDRRMIEEFPGDGALKEAVGS